VDALTILVVDPGRHGATLRIAGAVPVTPVLPQRSVRRLPTGGAQLLEGDFRDEEDIAPWAGPLTAPAQADRLSTGPYREPVSHVPS
jgi:hypothetical protein